MHLLLCKSKCIQEMIYVNVCLCIRMRFSHEVQQMHSLLCKSKCLQKDVYTRIYLCVHMSFSNEMHSLVFTSKRGARRQGRAG